MTATAVVGVYEHPTRWAPEKTEFQVDRRRRRPVELPSVNVALEAVSRDPYGLRPLPEVVEQVLERVPDRAQ